MLTISQSRHLIIGHSKYMNQPSQIEEKNSITFEVIRYITFYYFSVAIFLTVSQVVLEYFQIKRDIELQIKEIEESFSESLTNSLWEFNDIQTKAIVDGIAKTPSIIHVSVKNPKDDIVYAAGKEMEPLPRDSGAFFDPGEIFIYKKALKKQTEDQGAELIGTLRIYSGNKIIFEQLSHIVLSIVINSILKTIFLWAILLVFFNNKLKSPLEEFVKSISAINPKNPTPVDLDISKDIIEFSRIQNAFNDLIRQLTNYKEVLEAIVENKTELLKEKNEEVHDLLDQLKQAQSQILKQEKLTSLGILSAGIAHELKNPLNLSKNTSLMIKDLISENGELNPEFKNEVLKFLDIAVENNNRMNDIIKNMLIQARLETSDYSEINLKSFVNTNFNILSKSRNKQGVEKIRFINDVGPELKIEVQANDFGRLLLNIFENSLHSIKEKTDAKIVENFEGEIRVSAEELENGNVRFEVADNGMGIEEEDLDKILEPFYTTKPPGSGTGLGLYLSYEIIKQHGGKIDISSKPKEYAIMKIELPKKQKKA